MTRVAAWPLLAVAVLLAACGDGGTDPMPHVPSPPETSAAPGGPPPSAPPTLVGAKIRVVNLYLPGEGQPEKVDVLPGVVIGDQAAEVEPIYTLGLGESTDYFEPPANADSSAAVMAFFPEGVRTGDDKLIQFDNSMQAGDQWTLVLTRGSERSDGKPAFGFQVLDDKASGDGEQVNLPAPAAGKGQVVGYAHALTEALGEDDNSFKYGIPGEGCLTSTDENFDFNVGGTATVPFDVDPGTAQLAAYDGVDVGCAKDPELGPVDVEITEGGRTYVMVFTRSEKPQGREFLVLPTG